MYPMSAMFAVSAKSVCVCCHCRYKWVRSRILCCVCNVISVCCVHMGMLAVHVWHGTVRSVYNVYSASVWVCWQCRYMVVRCENIYIQFPQCQQSLYGYVVCEGIRLYDIGFYAVYATSAVSAMSGVSAVSILVRCESMYPMFVVTAVSVWVRR